MSAPPAAKGEPITDPAQLAAALEAGCKPPEAWRIGTEHEKFAYRLTDLSPRPHEGEDGIGAILRGLERFGWEPVSEHGKIIALQKAACNITLEPGG